MITATAIVTAILDRWHARQRRIDLEILWPQIKANARDLDHARRAFAFHAFNDSAWTCLGEGNIEKIIEELK
jgi:hypothetical protein